MTTVDLEAPRARDAMCTAMDVARWPYIKDRRDLLALVDQMREALVAVEWNAPRASWESPHCHACQALKRNGGSHNPSCPIDAALVAIGLDTQAKRDAARVGMRGGR